MSEGEGKDQLRLWCRTGEGTGNWKGWWVGVVALVVLSVCLSGLSTTRKRRLLRRKSSACWLRLRRTRPSVVPGA